MLQLHYINTHETLYRYLSLPQLSALGIQQSAMAKMLLLVISATIAGVLAEPPVPNSYLPPDSQYGSPIIANRGLSTASRFGGASARFGGAPSTQYGIPSASARSFGGIPSSQYGAPGLSARIGGTSGVLSRFGASGSSRSFNGALSTQYGVPSASSRFSGGSANFGGALSTTYGVPSASGRSFNGALSTQYGAPAPSSRAFSGALSSQYGAPGASGRFGSLSTQYGVPGGYADGGYAAAAARNLAREADLAEPANYEFSYEVDAAESGAAFSQEEARQDEQAQGSYRVLLPDGRLQIVEYEADLEGYKPRIRYEDTGAGGYARGGPQQRGLEGPY